MAIKEPERIWWKPYTRDERLWVAMALLWMMVSFVFMPVYHFIGAQNPPNETYRVGDKEKFRALVDGMVNKYKVGEEKGFPIVKPEPGSDVFVQASMWQWYPILELQQGKTYRIHLSSMDITHGFSIQPINMNFTVLPGYDYVVTLTPTTAGDYYIICNEYCGLGHHLMVGKMIVKQGGN
ncbi:MAG: cytochrome C oxidase subunit II [Deltaproteobacteria bacterium]|nr:cytochrome C oxidase subunit II [Deltaproteobacteria bacterium]